MPSPSHQDRERHFETAVETTRRQRMAEILGQGQADRGQLRRDIASYEHLIDLAEQAAFLVRKAKDVAQDARRSDQPSIIFNGVKREQKQLLEKGEKPAFQDRMWNAITLAREREMGRRHETTAPESRTTSTVAEGWVIAQPRRQADPKTGMTFPNDHGLALTRDGEVIVFAVSRVGKKVYNTIEATLIGGDTPVRAELDQRFNVGGSRDSTDKRTFTPDQNVELNLGAIQGALVDFAAQLRPMRPGLGMQGRELV